jgi:hypothetical protein
MAFAVLRLTMKSNLLGRSMGNSNRGRAHHHLATDICLRQEARLAQIWLARGRAIKTQYPDGAQRRRIYKTSLSPRSATTVLDLAEAVRAMLQDGAGYARWTSEQRFTFIRDVLALLSQVPSFRIATTLGRRQNFQDWPRLLRWWLAKATLPAQPAPREPDQLAAATHIMGQAFDCACRSLHDNCVCRHSE